MLDRIHWIASAAILAAALATAAVVGIEETARAGSFDPATVDLAAFDTLWDYDHPDSSEQRFAALLPRAEAAGDTAVLVEILSQTARAQGLQGKFETADATLDRAQALVREGMHDARIRLLLERGRVHNSAGRPAAARPLFLEAWEAARAAGADFHAVDAAHMMGIIEADSLALAWNEKAIALAESTKDTRARGWLGALYNNVGWIHHDAGRYEPALDTFTKALAYRLEKGQEPEVRIARWCIARCKRSLGRTGEALAEQEALLAEFERIGQADGYVHEEIAECLSIQGLSAQARPHFARAYEILSQDAWLAANEAERLARLKELGAAR